MYNNMGGLLLLFFTTFLLIIFPFSVSESSQELDLEVTSIHGQRIDGYNGNRNFAKSEGLSHSSKFARSSGSGSATHGGGSEQPNGNSGNGQGGGAVVPIIIAGAGNNNHRYTHHGTASCNKNCLKYPALIISIVVTASVIAHV